MKNIFSKLLVGIFIISYTTTFAQDIITKKDGTTLEVIIKEMKNNTIKYVDFKDPNGVIFTIDKAFVSDVAFKYGKTMEIKNHEGDKLYFAEDKINNIMFNFSAFGSNTLGLAYERAIAPGQSVLGEIKIYGIGINSNDIDRSGFGADIAYRLKTKKLFRGNSYRPKHILDGSYFSPVFGFSSGKTTYNHYYYNYDGSSTSIISLDHSVFHFGIQYGKQWILNNILSIDASVGFHYYGGSFDGDEDQNSFIGFGEPLRLGNMIGSDNKLFSFNLRIGILAGKESIVKKKEE